MQTEQDAESTIKKFGESLLVSTDFTNISLVYTSKRGHAVLYRAQRMGKWHLLKGLKKECADDAFAIGLLQKEFEIGYTLSHPNIAQTLSLENVEGMGMCIVMEYVDGITLRRRLTAGSVTTAEALRIINQLLDASAYIHQKQIVHRDLKPDNIMLTNNGGNVKVIDFGYSDADSYAVLKQPAGTRSYAAPEQLSGEAVDQRADIYALGKIISEMAEQTPWATRHRLRRVAKRCLHADPNCRYANDAQLANALHGHGTRQWLIASVTAAMIAIAAIILSIPTKTVTPSPPHQQRWQRQDTTTAKPLDTTTARAHDHTTARPHNSTTSLRDSQIVYLTTFARREAIIEMEKATQVERDTTIPITKRANESTYAVLRLQEEVRKEVAKVIGERSPYYPTALSVTKEALMQTIRDYNKKKYYNDKTNN